MATFRILSGHLRRSVSSSHFQSPGNRHNPLALKANESDALLGRWEVVVPGISYPLSFYAKRLGGRIDDPKRRIEGARGVDDGRRPGPWSKEGGEDTAPVSFHFQFRPDSLAD